MFVPDLAPHPELDGVLAVGWLQGDQPSTKGPVSEAFVDALFEACVSKEVRLTRGWQSCTLCGRDAPYPIVETWKGRSSPLGHSEIEVTGPDRRRYAAPQLIVHYVASHHYQPPAVFVEAVLHGEFSEDVYCQIRDFERMDADLAHTLKQGLTRRLGLADDLADRIDLRIALATVVRSFAGNPNQDVRLLYVAGHAIEVPWDGSAAGGLAILDSFCASHELGFEEHWATRRPRHSVVTE